MFYPLGQNEGVKVVIMRTSNCMMCIFWSFKYCSKSQILFERKKYFFIAYVLFEINFYPKRAPGTQPIRSQTNGAINPCVQLQLTIRRSSSLPPVNNSFDRVIYFRNASEFLTSLGFLTFRKVLVFSLLLLSLLF